LSWISCVRPGLQEAEEQSCLDSASAGAEPRIQAPAHPPVLAPRALIRQHGSSMDCAPPPGKHGQLFGSISAAGKGLAGMLLGKGGMYRGEWCGRRGKMTEAWRIECCNPSVVPLAFPHSHPSVYPFLQYSCRSHLIYTKHLERHTFSTSSQSWGPAARLRLSTGSHEASLSRLSIGSTFCHSASNFSEQSVFSGPPCNSGCCVLTS
jgi:hypothetical protein